MWRIPQPAFALGFSCPSWFIADKVFILKNYFSFQYNMKLLGGTPQPAFTLGFSRPSWFIADKVFILKNYFIINIT